MDQVELRSERLQQDMTLRGLYDILFENEDAPQALFLDQDQQKQVVTYGECRARALAAARTLRADGAQPGGYIALQLDTCPEWFALYWGIILSGANALLLDPSHSDDMTKYLMRQAGATALIGEKKREKLTGVRQYTKDELISAPSAGDYKPLFGTKTALCTSGTTQTSRVFVYDERRCAASCSTPCCCIGPTAASSTARASATSFSCPTITCSASWCACCGCPLSGATTST